MTFGAKGFVSPAWPLLLLLALGLPVREARAQDGGAGLRGVVVDESGAPLPFANVVVPAMQRSLVTNAQGRFALGALPAGPLEVLFRQVGFAPVRRTLTPRSGGSGTLDTIRLARLAILLEKVVVVSNPACTAGGFDGAQAPQLSALIDLARQNAEQYRLLATQYPVRYRLVRTRRFLAADGSVRGEKVDTLVQRTGERAPYRIGAVLTTTNGSTTFNPPSAMDMAEPAFLAAHCFRYAGIDSVDGRAVHRVEFLPTARVKSPDVSGALLLDAATGLLRRGAFRSVQVPRKSHFTAFQITTTYREVQPYLLLPGDASSVIELRAVDFQGAPIARQTEGFTLLDHAFAGASPGTPPAPR